MNLTAVPLHELIAEIDRRKIALPRHTNRIFEVVEISTGISKVKLIKRAKVKALTDARAVAMWAIWKMHPTLSMQKIANAVGATVAGTARHAINRVNDSKQSDPELHQIAERVWIQLNPAPKR